MFDWPVAAVILGVLGTVTAAVIRFVPQKTVLQNNGGEQFASKADIEAIKTLLRESQHYTKERTTEILNRQQSIQASAHSFNFRIQAQLHAKLDAINEKAVALMERLRPRRSHDDAD